MSSSYRYVAKVDRVGDRWRASIPGMPVEVMVDRLDQIPYHLGGSLVAYLGIPEDHIEVDFDVPGANRPPNPVVRARRSRIIAVAGQLAGGLGALLGVGMLAGTGAMVLVGGIATVAVCTLAESGWLSPRRPGASV